MRKLIFKTINQLGYTLKKIPDVNDTDLYEKVYTQEALLQKRFYNIGAGNFEHPFWTNVDYDNEWYKDNRDKTLKGIQYDLFSLEPMPIEDNKAEVVYTSHTVEHITDEHAQYMFNEAYRILKPGGYFRVTTPDIDLAYRAYQDNDPTFFSWIEYYSKPYMIEEMKLSMPLNRASLEQIFLYYFASSISTLHADGAPTRVTDKEIREIFANMPKEDALNHFVAKCPLNVQRKYVGNHINWWNKEKATRMMKAAGFSNVYTSGFGQSASPPLRNMNLFDKTHPELSVFVEGKK
jgi:predicted SAM-dependent methyltransferase